MAKVTSKLQVTVPKVIADQYGIRPGDDIQWIAAGEAIRVVPAGKVEEPDETRSKLRLFDQATERYRPGMNKSGRQSQNRGWTREDLYDRGRSR